MVLLTAGLLAILECAFAVGGRRRAYGTRQRLALATCTALVVLIAAGPFVARLPFAASVNATDVLVSQYLKGNLAGITASDINWLLSLKTRLVDALAAGAGWGAIAIVAIFAGAFVVRLVYLACNMVCILSIVRNGTEMCRGRKITAVVSSDTSVPFSTRGLTRYYVVIPQQVAADRKTLSLAMGHELQHIRQGDVDAEIVMSLLSLFLVLNPGFWFIAARVRRLGEYACDRAVLARRRFDARSYSLRLLEVAHHALTCRHAKQPSAFGVPLVGRSLPFLRRRTALKDRVLAIASHVDNPVRENRLLGSLLGATMICGVLFGATAFARPADWSHDRIMLSTVANLERLNQHNTLAQRSW
ncbi:hypothetical protein KUH32_02600 [Thalassococcus sp. CAU 1522]|uniref:Peptidase M56 domain-containing protein n=1 Tax=Thalassococcus arenae TaxID=2851652 RepID=A0ABS6N3Q6_9RHOB|nr:M56 family metallopeptidase [Thalassococcus arenae]MBV2358649.1 hypothetical protein [Thalassococcus arenae]